MIKEKMVPVDVFDSDKIKCGDCAHVSHHMCGSDYDIVDFEFVGIVKDFDEFLIGIEDNSRRFELRPEDIAYGFYTIEIA